jgi:hypothetical protein
VPPFLIKWDHRNVPRHDPARKLFAQKFFPRTQQTRHPPPRSGVSGVDWGQALNVGKRLLFSPSSAFVCAFLLLWVMKRLIPNYIPRRSFVCSSGSLAPHSHARLLKDR